MVCRAPKPSLTACSATRVDGAETSGYVAVKIPSRTLRIVVVVTDVVIVLEALRIAADYFGGLSRFVFFERLTSLIARADVPVDRVLVTPSGGVVEGGAVATLLLAVAIGWFAHRAGRRRN